MKIKKMDLLNYLSHMYGVSLENIFVLSDRPNIWKHACIIDGVKRLDYFKDSYCEINGVYVELAHCRTCNRLYVYYEMMEG